MGVKTREGGETSSFFAFFGSKTLFFGHFWPFFEENPDNWLVLKLAIKFIYYTFILRK